MSKLQAKTKGAFGTLKLLVTCSLLLVAFSYSTCKYSFKDSSPIPPEVKTFRVNYLENHAKYVNSYLSPNLTEQLKQKIIGNTRLRQTNDDSAHYDISGYVDDYGVSTTGINGANASTNRVSVSFHLIFKDNLDDKKSFEADVPYTHDFPATQSLSDAEASFNVDMVKQLVDGIFNKIFSNW